MLFTLLYNLDCILALQLDQVFNCIVPTADNITVTAAVPATNSITLNWTPSVKKSTCHNATKWKVGVVSFHNVQTTPPDSYVYSRSVHKFASWNNVNGDAWHNLSSHFFCNNYTYYQFYVINIMNIDKVSSSYVYFFERQGILFLVVHVSTYTYYINFIIEKPIIKKPQHSIFAVNQFSSVSFHCTATIHYLLSNGYQIQLLIAIVLKMV